MRGHPSQTSALARPPGAPLGVGPPGERTVSNLLPFFFAPGGLRNPKAKPRKNRRCEMVAGGRALEGV